MPFTRYSCSHRVSIKLSQDDDKFKILGAFTLKKYDTNIRKHTKNHFIQIEMKW